MTQQNFDSLVKNYPEMDEEWQTITYLLKTKEPIKNTGLFYRALLVKRAFVFDKLPFFLKIRVLVMAFIADLLGFRI